MTKLIDMLSLLYKAIFKEAAPEVQVLTLSKKCENCRAQVKVRWGSWRWECSWKHFTLCLTKRTWTISISQVWSGVVSVEVQGGLQLRKSKLKSHFKSFDTNLMWVKLVFHCKMFPRALSHGSCQGFKLFVSIIYLLWQFPAQIPRMLAQNLIFLRPQEVLHWTSCNDWNQTFSSPPLESKTPVVTHKLT